MPLSLIQKLKTKRGIDVYVYDGEYEAGIVPGIKKNKNNKLNN